MKRSAFIKGTYSFLSQNTIRGYTHSRRDDIESLLYTMFYLIENRLPWKSFSKYQKEYEPLAMAQAVYKEMRRKVSDSKLAMRFPECLQPALLYVRRLGFFDKPDYEYINGLFREKFTIAPRVKVSTGHNDRQILARVIHKSASCDRKDDITIGDMEQNPWKHVGSRVVDEEGSIELAQHSSRSNSTCSVDEGAGISDLKISTKIVEHNLVSHSGFERMHGASPMKAQGEKLKAHFYTEKQVPLIETSLNS